MAKDPSANGRAHADAVRAAQARLVVFPELSLTGYELDADVVSPTDEVLTPIVAACAATGSSALVGAPVKDADGEHIATISVRGTGAEVVYRKSYLGAAEMVRFCPGPGPVAIDVDGWRVGLGICKDTGTAQHIQDTAALGVDLYVAGLVHLPDELAEQDARGIKIARACSAHVAFAGFAGPTGGSFDATAGTSTIWSPSGDVVARAGTEPGDLARAVIGAQLTREIAR